MPPLNNWCDLTAPLNRTNQSRSVESLENGATPSVWVSCVAHRTCCCLVRFSLGDKEAAWRLVHVRRLPVDINTRGGGVLPGTPQISHIHPDYRHLIIIYLLSSDAN